MKRLLLGAAVGALVAAPGAFALGGGLVGSFTDDSGAQWMDIHGAIRCCSQGNYYVVDDDTHAPLNLTVDTARSGYDISLRYPEARKVGTLQASMDETLVAKGFTAGASVGRKSARIRCARYGIRVDCRQIRKYAAGNFWVSGRMYLGQTQPGQ